MPLLKSLSAPASLLGTALVMGASIPMPASAQTSTGCLRVQVMPTSTWSAGYSANAIVTNQCAATVNGWTVEFDLPSGTTISKSWRANRTSSGQHYVFTNVSYNGTLAPGDSEDFGFNASGLNLPTQCTINGQSCSGGSTSDVYPPTTPANLSGSDITASRVNLTWQASQDNVGVTSYMVYQNNGLATETTSTSTLINGLTPATTYQFQVVAKDAAGNQSAWSAPIAVTTLAETGSGGGNVVQVSTAAQLTYALANATPGQTIQLAPGEYHGSFIATRAGTEQTPITLTGPATAILVNDGPSGSAPSCPAPTAGWNPGYGLWLFNSAYWNLKGFSVAHSKKGIILDNSPKVTIDGVHVHHVEDEAVHFRRSSADGIIRNSHIEYTGLVQPEYGEGVYIGSAGSNWACHGNTGGVDRSDRVQVLNNIFGPYITAEHIDIKEGTFDGVIRGNTFNGQGIAGKNSADSWVDVKGMNYSILGNVGAFASPGTFADGYQTHNLATTPAFSNGCGNTWRDNRSDLGGVGAYAINITSVSKCSAYPNVVYTSNTVTNATKGLTNIPVTP